MKQRFQLSKATTSTIFKLKFLSFVVFRWRLSTVFCGINALATTLWAMLSAFHRVS